MKQRIAIKVDVIKCDNCRSKAMETASSMDGVISVRLEKRENIVVIGDGVNAAKLCKNLRKRLGFASLEILEDVKEETEDNCEANENPNTFASYTSSCEKCRNPDSCCCTIL